MNFYWFYNALVVLFMFVLIAILWIPIHRKRKIKAEITFLTNVVDSMKLGLVYWESKHFDAMIEMRWTNARRCEDVIKSMHERMNEKYMRIAYLKEQLDA